MNTNLSSNVTVRYVYLPVDLQVRIHLYVFVGFCGLYAILANGMILYLTTKLKKSRKRGNSRSFDRFFVRMIFIQSLAVSDLLCACISTPLTTTLNFLDIVNNDLVCKAVRFCNIFFPVVTINNLFLIGIERYLAVFHPYRVPTLRTVKYLVISAWVLGAMITFLPTVTYRVLKVDVEPGIYTTICIYDKTVAAYKIIMFVFSGIMYVVPALILTVTNTRILVYLRKRRIERQNDQLHNNQQRHSWRFKGTITFVVLIFTFVIPYFLFVVFTAINIMLKLQMTFTTEYILQRMTMVFANSNSVVSPTVLLLTLPDLRRLLKSFLSNHFTCCRSRRIAAVSASQDPDAFAMNSVSQGNSSVQQ